MFYLCLSSINFCCHIKYFNFNQTEGAKRLPPPPPHWHILLYDFLVTHPNFIKFGDFSKNLSGINFLIFFFKIRTGFCSVSTFHNQVLFFCTSPVEKMNISLIMCISFTVNISLTVFEFRRFRKSFYSLF